MICPGEDGSPGATRTRCLPFLQPPEPTSTPPCENQTLEAVIAVAGLGTRLLPATKSMPKERLPVVDRPVIQYVVEEAVASGCDAILIIAGRGKRTIEDPADTS